jgi:hypothetical protein
MFVVSIISVQLILKWEKIIKKETLLFLEEESLLSTEEIVVNNLILLQKKDSLDQIFKLNKFQ